MADFIFQRSRALIETEIKIVPNEQVVAPFTIVLNFDNPVVEIGHTVENVAAQMFGGPFTVGIHARESVLTTISPSHPLIVFVYSRSIVNLQGSPTIEF
jgi:hypothetical protein